MRVRFVVPGPVVHHFGQLGQGRFLRRVGHALEHGGQLGQRENRLRLPALARLQDGGGGNNAASGQHGDLGQIDGKALAAHHRHPVRDGKAAGIDGPNHGVNRADHGVDGHFRDIGQTSEQISEYIAYALPGKFPIPGEYAGNKIEQPGKYADDIFYDGRRDLYGAFQAVDQRQTRDLKSRAQDTGQQRGQVHQTGAQGLELDPQGRYSSPKFFTVVPQIDEPCRQSCGPASNQGQLHIAYAHHPG